MARSPPQTIKRPRAKILASLGVIDSIGRHLLPDVAKLVNAPDYHSGGIAPCGFESRRPDLPSNPIWACQVGNVAL